MGYMFGPQWSCRGREPLLLLVNVADIGPWWSIDLGGQRWIPGILWTQWSTVQDLGCPSGVHGSEVCAILIDLCGPGYGCMLQLQAADLSEQLYSAPVMVVELEWDLYNAN